MSSPAGRSVLSQNQDRAEMVADIPFYVCRSCAQAHVSPRAACTTPLWCTPGEQRGGGHRHRFAAAHATSRQISFDYQLAWPYLLLPAELVLVALQLRTPIAIASVLLVLFQTPSDNAFLKWVSAQGVFARYKDAKFFCGVLTAWTFVSFLVVSYIMARSG